VPALFLIGLAAAMPTQAQAKAAAPQPVAVELILAVDCSSSVNRQEFELQMRGLSAALRSPAVAQAIQGAGEGGVAVALLQWAGEGQQVLATPWHLMHSAEDAATYADLLDNTRRYVDGGSTAMGEAVVQAVIELERNDYAGARLLIDVSTDGQNNVGRPPEDARQLAEAAGVTVNGLAILTEHPRLDEVLRARLIAGSGAFVIAASSFETYRIAIEQKLLRELGQPGISMTPLPQSRPDSG